MVLPGCGDDDDSTAGSAEEARPADPGELPASDLFAGLAVHQNLMDIAHLAEISHVGEYIDFGTPAHLKYTVGDWNSGWGSDGAEGDTTYTHVGRRGRIYFHADEAGPMTVRIRIRPHGTRAATPYINNQQLESIFFEEGPGFRDIDFQLPADKIRAGENYLLLTFGGTEPIAGEDVAVALDSVRIVPGTSIPEGEYAAPAYDSFVSSVMLGESERLALVARRPTTIRYHAQIPADGKLGFGVGFEGQGEAAVKVYGVSETGERSELWSGTAGQAWRDQLIDLSAHAGKIARIDLVAVGQGAGRVAWSAPSILVPSARPAAPTGRAQNVVVLLIDTLRADKIRPYNPRTRVRTPALDAVASAGAVFELAESAENWTKPAVASVLTGLYPMTHRQKTTESRLPESAEMLSEHLDAAGFNTGSFIANGYVSDRFGFDQGWDHYTNYIRERKSTEAENVFREAGDWIEENRDERFFAYIQTIDPHVPYDPPTEWLRRYDDREYEGHVRPRMTADLLEEAKRSGPEFFSASDRRRLIGLHDGEIAQHDHFLAQFIERLKSMGVWENTVVLITSDHGEEFDDHGSWGHGHSIFQELLHVPLIVHLPGVIDAGTRIEEAVSTASIPATVLDYLGVDPMQHAEAPSLMGYVHGQRPARPPVAFSDYQDDRRVITTGRYKFILRHNLTSTMFDLQRDPGEETQIDAGHARDASIARRYARIMLSTWLGAAHLADWLAPTEGARATLNEEEAEMDETIRGQLRALGYVD